MSSYFFCFLCLFEPRVSPPVRHKFSERDGAFCFVITQYLNIGAVFIELHHKLAARAARRAYTAVRQYSDKTRNFTFTAGYHVGDSIPLGAHSE